MLALYLSLPSLVADYAGLRLACRLGRNTDPIYRLNSQKEWVLAPGRWCLS